jgi:glycosyltransferase involved in cell wall biosynthesis
VNVGLAVRGISAEAGGGYTFSTDLYHAILKRSETRQEHRFIAFGLEEKAPDFVSSSSLPYHSLHRKRLTRLRQRANRARERIRPFANGVVAGNGQEVFADERIRAAGVDFVINLWPELCLTKEVPYLSIVWDLQHRLQPFFPEVSSNGTWRHREQVLTELLRRATYVVVGNDRGKTELERFYGIDSSRIRRLAHPTPAFALEAEPELTQALPKSLALPRDYLLYPAQFWPHKNHVLLLDAIKLLAERDNLTVPVVFCGSDKGNGRYVREEVNRLGLSTQVFFLDFVDRETLVALYRNARALIYLTLFGPENLPPLEAFALGCPVVASAVPGSEEQLAGAALLVDPLDVEEVAAGIKRVVEDDEFCASLVRNGRQRASEWTVDDFASGIFEILDEFSRIRRAWT